jgi:hypothetical protein
MSAATAGEKANDCTLNKPVSILEAFFFASLDDQASGTIDTPFPE